MNEDLYYCRIYHSKTSHSLGSLSDIGEDIEGTHHEMDQAGREFIKNFPEYSYEVVKVND